MLEGMMSTVVRVSVHPYSRLEFTCKGCGVTARVDYEYGVGHVIGQDRDYRHCSDDVARHLPGPIVAVWEKHGRKWVLAANRSTALELAGVE